LRGEERRRKWGRGERERERERGKREPKIYHLPICQALCLEDLHMISPYLFTSKPPHPYSPFYIW
jgi:hypothetical protein